jgi:hypothetical protein
MQINREELVKAVEKIMNADGAKKELDSYMDIEKKMKALIDKRNKLNLNDDYGIQNCWKEMIEILVKDEKKTLYYLEHCSKGELYWISEVFEDIAGALQSKELIICLRKLDNKYPELEMTKDIDTAESYI